MKTMFRNRVEAGGLLAQRLAEYVDQPDVLVLALPPGGVPVAGEVARRLHAPLDVLVVRTLDVPCQAGVAMGAIAPGGVCVLDDALVDRLDIERDTIGAVRLFEEQELERREQSYRGNRPPPAVPGKTIVLVDDSIVTGVSMHAAIVYLHQHGSGRVIVAAPVIAPEPLRELRRIADDVVAVILPESAENIGQWFDDSAPTTDGEVRRLLGFNEPQGVPS